MRSALTEIFHFRYTDFNTFLKIFPVRPNDNESGQNKRLRNMSPEPDPIHRLFALSVERSRMSSCLLIPVTLLGRSFITPTGGTSIWSPLLVFITVLMIAIAIRRASKTPIIIPSMSDSSNIVSMILLFQTVLRIILPINDPA